MTLKLSRHTNTYNVQTEITNSFKVQKARVNKSLIVYGTIGAHTILKIIAGKLAPRTNLWDTSDERKDAVPSPGSPKRSVANTVMAVAPPDYHLTKWCASEDWRAGQQHHQPAVSPSSVCLRNDGQRTPDCPGAAAPLGSHCSIRLFELSAIHLPVHLDSVFFFASTAPIVPHFAFTVQLDPEGHLNWVGSLVLQQ